MNPTTESAFRGLAATRSLIVMTAVYLMGTSTFAQDKPQAVAAESPSNAQEISLGEKIRDVSSDKKFAVRIRYDAEANHRLSAAASGPDGFIHADAVRAVELVTLPGKEVIKQLLGARAGGFSSLDDIKLIWSPDSKAFAFYCEETRAYSLTIAELRDGKFEFTNEEELRVDVKGDVVIEHVRPLRWVKPGMLLLEQRSTFRSERPGVTLRLTAAKDAQSGKYKVVSHKRVRSASKDD
jgi:hypothetical protein